MNAELEKYIADARKLGHDDARIEGDLLAAGWHAATVKDAIGGAGLRVPLPPPAMAASGSPARGFTVRGLEYFIMFLAMGIAAVALGSLLHSSVDAVLGTDQGGDDSLVSMSAAALIVALPVFSLLFLRLKRQELADPGVRSDTSRRWAVNLTLIITFLVGMGHLIFYVYGLFDSVSGGWTSNTLHMLITLLIAGGIFAYYWVDGHQKAKT